MTAHRASLAALAVLFTASMQLTTALEGTGGLDSDGDYVLNAGAYGWSAVDCSTVTIP